MEKETLNTLSVPVRAKVWLRPQAAATINLSARASITLGASRRLVSPWPSWPLSLRPEEKSHKSQVLNNGKIFLRCSPDYLRWYCFKYAFHFTMHSQISQLAQFSYIYFQHTSEKLVIFDDSGLPVRFCFLLDRVS